MHIKLLLVYVLALFAISIAEEQVKEDVEDKKDRYWEIPLAEFESIVTSGNALVIDVREPHEVSEIRVDAKKYINIPLKTVESALQLSDEDFQDKFDAPKPDLEEEIVFICRSGRRSEFSLKTARELNYKKTRHFFPGTSGWTKLHPDQVIKQDELNKSEADSGKEEL